MMTCETNQVQGINAITEKLAVCDPSLPDESLELICEQPFAKSQRDIATLDAQPGGQGGSIIVLITGVVKVS